MSFVSTQNHIYIALVVLRTIKAIHIYYCVNKYKLCHSMFIYQCSKRLQLIRTPTTSVRSQLLSLMPSYSTSLPTSSTNKPLHKLFYYGLPTLFLLFNCANIDPIDVFLLFFYETKHNVISYPRYDPSRRTSIRSWRRPWRTRFILYIVQYMCII